MPVILFSLPLADFDGHMDWDGGWGVLMIVGIIIFWALVIVGIVWLLRELASTRTASGTTRDDDPLRTLDRRLAEGTISADDYRERRAMLEGQQPQSGE